MFSSVRRIARTENEISEQYFSAENLLRRDRGLTFLLERIWETADAATPMFVIFMRDRIAGRAEILGA